LDARARVTFVATAEDTEESEDSSRNDLSNEGLKEYLDEVMNEVKKYKNDPSHINKEDETQT
jgi:hypothetical protein